MIVRKRKLPDSGVLMVLAILALVGPTPAGATTTTTFGPPFDVTADSIAVPGAADPDRVRAAASAEEGGSISASAAVETKFGDVIPLVRRTGARAQTTLARTLDIKDVSQDVVVVLRGWISHVSSSRPTPTTPLGDQTDARAWVHISLSVSGISCPGECVQTRSFIANGAIPDQPLELVYEMHGTEQDPLTIEGPVVAGLFSVAEAYGGVFGGRAHASYQLDVSSIDVIT